MPDQDKPEQNDPVEARPIPLRIQLRWPAQFTARVEAAKVQLRGGMDESEVREQHGGVVLRYAKEELDGSYPLGNDRRIR